MRVIITISVSDNTPSPSFKMNDHKVTTIQNQAEENIYLFQCLRNAKMFLYVFCFIYARVKQCLCGEEMEVAVDVPEPESCSGGR